jgi:hypothetical protein
MSEEDQIMIQIVREYLEQKYGKKVKQVGIFSNAK